MAYALLEWFYDALRALGLLATKSAKITLIGLDNAGKTTLLGMLKNGTISASRPTMHPTSESITVGSLSIEAHDLGGHCLARRLWSDYCISADAIVFMCDATDRERFKEARDELGLLLDNETLTTTPILVLGNKIDRNDAVGATELQHELGLDALTRVGRPINLYMCSITGRQGYKEAFDWLARKL